MPSDIDRFPSNLIAAAMGSTVVAVGVSLAALVVAECYFTVICECLEWGFQIHGDDLWGSVMMMPIEFVVLLLSGWGVPVAIFQLYCFYILASGQVLETIKGT